MGNIAHKITVHILFHIAGTENKRVEILGKIVVRSDTASLHGMGGQYGMGKKFLLPF